MAKKKREKKRKAENGNTASQPSGSTMPLVKLGGLGILFLRKGM